jgi:UDP-N-acetylmuramoyl-L-alanyl-D-glutamate--2,6-diaminopimelate ligase
MHVVMEVSSHSLEQERVAGIRFAVGAFTNLTQDHLDYHKDMDSYRKAKLRLFERIEGDGCFTVVNQEDPSAEAFVKASRVPCHTYGAGGDCRADGVSMDGRRTMFTARTPWGDATCSMRLLGRHNVSNALCAVTICGGLGIPLPQAAEGLASLQRVPGRFEHVDNDRGFQVVIDYAHTDDGLRNVLNAARGICTGKVIVVFGCGGDRDKGKRPKMGAVAAELADYAFVTSDNPRTEEPDRIILDIEVGLQHAGQHKYDDYQLITDRTEAIRAAIRMARPGDLVLIAGKGHEDYQILGTTRIHYDDREVAQQILEES